LAVKFCIFDSNSECPEEEESCDEADTKCAEQETQGCVEEAVERLLKRGGWSMRQDQGLLVSHHYMATLAANSILFLSPLSIFKLIPGR
jgi:hypothetical protein